MQKAWITNLVILYSVIWLYQQQEYPLNRKGEPTSKGIELYVKQNEAKFISEFQKLVNDTLYEVYINVDDLSKYQDYSPLELGRFYVPNEIFVTNEEKFIAYEISMLSKYKRKTILAANNCVKATVFHELMHVYFNQIIKEMKYDSMQVSSDYNNFSIIRTNSGFGSRFIEEGMCEYITIKAGEAISSGESYIPETIEDITNKENISDVLYEYSVEYVRCFVDYFGVKKAVQILVAEKPPTFSEILMPTLFFDRIMIEEVKSFKIN